MKILEKIDWHVLNTYIENNLIVANKHVEYDIWILNYSPKTQLTRIWDDYTMSCRGLVIDDEGNILARPFQKFKNYEEYDPADIDMSQEFEAFEKMDGSFIILFYYTRRMEWIVASRGSFISEQSIEARKMLKTEIYNKLDVNETYLFEIIYDKNRIVVDYGNRYELVLLSRINTKTGTEVTYNELVNKYKSIFTIVKKVELKTLSELIAYQATNRENEEGIVVRLANGFRFKLKFSEYIRLHGILTNVSNLTVWEYMMNNYNFDELLDRVPDEFYGWLKRTETGLQIKFNEIERQALLEFIRIYHVNDIVDRKSFANEALKTKNYSILFKLYDKRSYDTIIWKQIRPTFSKPFKDGYEYIT